MRYPFLFLACFSENRSETDTKKHLLVGKKVLFCEDFVYQDPP
ncbi:hypothetical protein FHS90_000597 [Rufibacter quisquiliarum]|uniref:Uncharacterized protein n=1 Tax=Rufibacter quisquiliarum TaxID=1549639 RepID=A0A839GJX7_9BACT|nr:hypothetical protein [Rufibacter quisquiliarum]